MTSPWPPPPAPDQHAYPPVPGAGPGSRTGVVVGWLLVLVTAVAAFAAAVAQLPWASGELLSARTTEFNAGDLVNLGDGALPFAVVASVLGLVLAAWFGVAAVPAGRVGRIGVTVGVAVVVGVLTAAGISDVDEYSPLGETLVILLLVALLPAVVLLVLVWRGARRAAGVTAAVFAGLALLGAVVAALQLVGGTATVEAGTWVAVVLALAGLGSAVQLARSAPRRGVSPARAG